MINHARTLLLNDPADRPDLGVFGEEYVPPDALRLDLAGDVAAVHRILFGANPEPLYQNMVLRLYMNALHSVFQTERYILELDSRCTYLHSAPPPVSGQTATIFPETRGGPVLIGSAAADSVGGSAAFLYEVEARGDPSEVMVTGYGTGFKRTAVYPEKIRLSCGVDLAFPVRPSGKWTVAVKAPLRFGLVEVLARLDASPAAKTLIRSAPDEFRELWATPTTVERTAGILAGLVHRLEGIKDG